MNALVTETPAYWKPLVALLATSGLRISEAFGLRRRDLDLSAGTVTVRHAVVELQGKLNRDHPKVQGVAANREADTSVVAMFRKHPLPLNPDGFVFSQLSKSAPLSRTMVQQTNPQAGFRARGSTCVSFSSLTEEPRPLRYWKKTRLLCRVSRFSDSPGVLLFLFPTERRELEASTVLFNCGLRLLTGTRALAGEEPLESFWLPVRGEARVRIVDAGGPG